MALCPSVHLSLNLSQAGMYSVKMAIKRHHAINAAAIIARGTLRSLNAKDRGKILTEPCLTEAPNTCYIGVVRICDFRQLTRCISKTIQDRRIPLCER